MFATHSQKVGARESNFWTYSDVRGWDLTHGNDNDLAAEPGPHLLSLDCEVSRVIIDPAKTALLIVDMQNYSTSAALLSEVPQSLHDAEYAIRNIAIPAAREAGIQIVWLNWGLTEEELRQMPPGVLRVFGWQTKHRFGDGCSWARPGPNGHKGFSCSEEQQSRMGLGAELGIVKLADGRYVDAGKALMRNTWNAAICDALKPIYDRSQTSLRPDVLVHKNRNSGLWKTSSDCNQYLSRNDIRTLLFVGMNTDQCVLSSLIDAQARGFDTILLRDGCATDSPPYAQQCVEWNCCRNFGFLSSCAALANAKPVCP